jgi:Flp pilus assembly protein TadB
VQEKLLDKYLNIVERHQTIKDNEYFKQIKREHDNRTKILEMETKKQELRTNLFSNQKLIIFFMVFPIIISSILVYFLKAYVFASFIILMWYGMILAFYFSQSDALTKLIEVFKREKRNT